MSFITRIDYYYNCILLILLDVSFVIFYQTILVVNFSFCFCNCDYTRGLSVLKLSLWREKNLLSCFRRREYSAPRGIQCNSKLVIYKCSTSIENVWEKWIYKWIVYLKWENVWCFQLFLEIEMGNYFDSGFNVYEPMSRMERNEVNLRKCILIEQVLEYEYGLKCFNQQMCCSWILYIYYCYYSIIFVIYMSLSVLIYCFKSECFHIIRRYSLAQITHSRCSIVFEFSK